MPRPSRQASPKAEEPLVPQIALRLTRESLSWPRAIASPFRARLKATCGIAALVVGSFASLTPAIAQPDDGRPLIIKPVPAGDREEHQTPEFRANWGLPMHGFDAAYAVGATGKGVVLGQLDQALHGDHPEFAGVSFEQVGTYPLATTLTLSNSGEINNHGNHVAGIMIARKDGQGMHGGAYGVETFLVGDMWGHDKPSSNDETGKSIVESGADFLNHSYGYNFNTYRIPITLPDGTTGYHGPDIRHMLPRGGAVDIVHSSANGVVNVTSAGNDRLYSTSFTPPENRHDARPRLFRGISPGSGLGAHAFLQRSHRGISDEEWRDIEKGIIVAVNLNATGEINHTSNICGIAKYWCMGAAGGMLAEPHEAGRVARPDMPLPIDYGSADSTGTKTIYEILTDPTLTEDQYRILSLAVRSMAAQGASAEDILASDNLQPIYRMNMGTSMASPMLAAGLAVIKSRFPYLENWQIRDVVLTTARDLGAPGIDRVYGWGMMDIAAAIGGPRMLFQLRRDYLQTLLQYEREAAQQYNETVAITDQYATSAYKLKIQIIENEIGIRDAREAGNIEEAERLTAINRELIPQEAEQRRLAHQNELTRIQPNNPLDTPEAAFEYINFIVNIPGMMSDDCPIIFCVEDVWTNDISGPGGLEKQGAGTLALAGDNIYQGGTKITEGVLQVGIGGTKGSVIGDIENNAKLHFARSDEWIYKDIISGTGEVVILGGGTFRLTNDNTYKGESRVYDGVLAVDGSVASHVRVYQGGTLGGNGTVSSLVAHVGGIVAPGNSIGTLRVAGDATLETGSIYDVEIENGRSDKIEIAGTANLGGTVVVRRQEQLNALTLNDALGHIDTRYNIVTAGVINGTFDGALPNALFIKTDLDYSSSDVNMTIARNDVSFASVAATANGVIVGGVIEPMGLGHTLHDAIVTMDDRDLVQQSFALLSGEAHASAQAALALSGTNALKAATDRLRASFGQAGATKTPVLGYADNGRPTILSAESEGGAIWWDTFGVWGKSGSDGNATDLHSFNGGLAFGVDNSVGDWRIGLLGSYGKSSFATNAGLAKGRSDNYLVGLYGGTEWGDIAFRTGAAMSWHDVSTTRSISIPGLSDTLTASYGSSSFHAFGELGYGIALNDAKLEPFANLTHITYSSDSFAEQGGAAALSVSKATSSLTFTTLGLRGEADVQLGRQNATIRGMIGWQHAFGDTSTRITNAFATGNAFTVSGAPIARDSAVIEAGLDLNFTQNATFGLSYTGQLSGSAQDHGFKAKLNVRF